MRSSTFAVLLVLACPTGFEPWSNSRVARITPQEREPSPSLSQRYSFSSLLLRRSCSQLTTSRKPTPKRTAFAVLLVLACPTGFEPWSNSRVARITPQERGLASFFHLSAEEIPLLFCRSCSQLTTSRKPTPKRTAFAVLFGVGLPDRIRTCDLQSRSLTRYPAVPRADIFLQLLYHTPSNM